MSLSRVGVVGGILCGFVVCCGIDQQGCLVGVGEEFV